MTAIVGLDHVQLACPTGSEDTLRHFYGEVLGMTELPKPPVLAARAPVLWDDNLPGVRRFHTQDPVGNRLEFQQAQA
jgi:hypothetical protein